MHNKPVCNLQELSKSVKQYPLSCNWDIDTNKCTSVGTSSICQFKIDALVANNITYTLKITSHLNAQYVSYFSMCKTNLNVRSHGKKHQYSSMCPQIIAIHSRNQEQGVKHKSTSKIFHNLCSWSISQMHAIKIFLLFCCLIWWKQSFLMWQHLSQCKHIHLCK